MSLLQLTVSQNSDLFYNIYDFGSNNQYFTYYFKLIFQNDYWFSHNFVLIMHPGFLLSGISLSHISHM